MTNKEKYIKKFREDGVQEELLEKLADEAVCLEGRGIEILRAYHPLLPGKDVKYSTEWKLDTIYGTGRLPFTKGEELI